jgi:hypothetical protein
VIACPSQLLGRLLEELPDVFAAEEVLRRLDPMARTMLAQVGAAVSGGGAGLGSPALADGCDGAAQAHGVSHVRRAAGLGEGEQLLLGPAALGRVEQRLRTRR